MIKVSYNPVLSRREPWQVTYNGRVVARFAEREDAEYAAEVASWHGA